jgi:hypothetical protein
MSLPAKRPVLANNGHDSGATQSTLQISPLDFSDAGLYSVVISNACGVVTGQVSLTMTRHLPWPWASWNVSVLANPLAATIGPDLKLMGSGVATNYALSVGTTADFGLPEEGGRIVNVMEINPQAGAALQVPLITPAGSNSVNSYTLIMDLYEPDTSLGTSSTIFQSLTCCIGSGQDGVALTLDAQNYLHLTGSAAGVPFYAASTVSLPVDAWSRVALVVNDPQDGVGVNLFGYLNGQPVASLFVPTPVGLPTNWNNSPPTLLSAQTNAAAPNAEFYVSSIQFHAVALISQAIASIGSPDNGPIPENQTSIGPSPVLSATVSDGVVGLSWTTGGPYRLQETTELSSGVWRYSSLPFTESLVGDQIVTTATANPAIEGPAKFYRLIFRP